MDIAILVTQQYRWLRFLQRLSYRLNSFYLVYEDRTSSETKYKSLVMLLTFSIFNEVSPVFHI